jgi:predicted membrane protein
VFNVTLTEEPKTATPAPTPRRSPVSAAQIVGGAVLILIGLLWLLERTGAVDLSATVVFAIATMAIGIALMFLAREGSHPFLIVLGTIFGLIALITTAAPFEGFQGGVGDRVIEVSTIEDIETDYELAMGSLTIDLRDVEDFDTDTRLSAQVGTGDLIIRVPSEVEVVVEAEVGAGEVDLFGRNVDGIGIDETYESPGFDESEQRLFLDLEVFAGRVEVTDD